MAAYNPPSLNLTGELSTLFAAVADQAHQSDMDSLMLRPLFNNLKTSSIRASSPHMLFINCHLDTTLGVQSSEDATHINFCPVTREGSTFVFGLNILQRTARFEDMPEPLSREILARLPENVFHQNHGDFPGWCSMARVGKTGSMVVNISNPGIRTTATPSLSALFLEEEGGAPQRTTQFGLWALALALKIEQKARKNGTVYDLMQSGRSLPDQSLKTLGERLLTLDTSF